MRSFLRMRIGRAQILDELTGSSAPGPRQNSARCLWRKAAEADQVATELRPIPGRARSSSAIARPGWAHSLSASATLRAGRSQVRLRHRICGCACRCRRRWRASMLDRFGQIERSQRQDRIPLEPDRRTVGMPVSEIDADGTGKPAIRRSGCESRRQLVFVPVSPKQTSPATGSVHLGNGKVDRHERLTDD